MTCRFLGTVGINGMSNYGEDFVFNFVGYGLGRCDLSVCHMLRNCTSHQTYIPWND